MLSVKMVIELIVNDLTEALSQINAPCLIDTLHDNCLTTPGNSKINKSIIFVHFRILTSQLSLTKKAIYGLDVSNNGLDG